MCHEWTKVEEQGLVEAAYDHFKGAIYSCKALSFTARSVPYYIEEVLSLLRHSHMHEHTC